MSDIWNLPAKPELKAIAGPGSSAGPFFWDDDKNSGNCALRKPDGELVLVVIQEGSSWGIYQFQRFGVPDNRGDAELIQIRGDRKAARDCAVEMAMIVGLI